MWFERLRHQYRRAAYHLIGGDMEINAEGDWWFDNLDLY